MKTFLSLKSLLLSVFMGFLNGESNFTLTVKATTKGGSNVTLTTATVCSGECIKPTSLSSRRMAVDQNEGAGEVTPLTFFRARDTKRQTRSEIWKWDYWCQLQQKPGTCSNHMNKFYYDSQLDLCRPFKYSGCKGNKNNFETLEECERKCKGASLMEIKDMKESEECHLQPNSGLCVAIYIVYYHDINDNECKQFIYGGCGGNENRFNTKYKCTRQCGQRVKEKKRDKVANNYLRLQ